MKRMMLVGVFFSLTTLLALATPGDADKEQKAKKEALQELNEKVHWRAGRERQHHPRRDKRPPFGKKTSTGVGVSKTRTSG